MSAANPIFAKEHNAIGWLGQISVLGAQAMVSASVSAAAAQSCEVKVCVVDPTGVVYS